ncbi:MAG: helix-turn-helix transcriptional regulator [Bacteroidetes bacterium]|nr:helix-turn-helix transcriptional regulator [Bacteroidota bacterium]
MRQRIKIPRIIKINWVKELTVSVVFNNGESRLIDFHQVFKSIGVSEKSPAFVLFNPDQFSKVELQNHTLSWETVDQFITNRDGRKVRVPFEIGADVLLKFSKPEQSDHSSKIGQLVREERLKSGMTQQDLAIRSGTTRAYISRIENDRSDLELATLRKIVETGLGRKLDISIR